MSKFYEKLVKVQQELKAPKSNYNKFGNFRYRSAEDILEAVKPLNAKYGLVLTLADTPILIGERYYIQATARITDGEETHEVTAYAREAETKKGMDDSQITGTASSYARKYALNGLYNISDTYDFDRDIKKANLDDESLKTLYKISKGHEDKAKKILKDYGYRNSLEIRKKDFEKYNKRFKKGN